MVWWRCRVCEAVGHLVPDRPVDEWYRAFAPDLPPGELPALECPGCGAEVRVGSRVTIRVVPAGLDRRFRVGQEGVVTAVEPGDPPVFVVAFRRPKRQARFRRSELSYVFGRG